jgi:ribulose-phosphate 3-epimerase
MVQNSPQIIPAILVSSEQEFLKQIKAIQDSVSLVQIDIADGTLVPDKTWADPDVVAENLEIDCELHLMVADPLTEARYWIDVPQVKRILVHYESNPENIADVLAQIHSYDWEVGIVLNPDTPADVLANFIEEIDSIMCMGVPPGQQGQSFVPDVLEKVITIKKTYPNRPIAIDGGINEETIPEILKTPTDRLCIGSAIFGNEKEPKKNIQQLKEMIEKLTQG